MSQPIIDISGKPMPNTFGKPVIVFYKENSWAAACQLEQGPDRHEGHFGCYLKTTCDSSKNLAIDTVEHAEKIIEALRLAIQEGWLFTESQMKKYRNSATDTRASINEKINRKEN